MNIYGKYWTQIVEFTKQTDKNQAFSEIFKWSHHPRKIVNNKYQ